MKKIVAVIGLLAVGAVAWAMFGERLTTKAVKTLDTVQSEVHDKAQDITDSIK